MIPTTINIKAFFFDRPRVIRAVDRARRRALSRAGAFIRTRARTLIRKRKTTSAPGKPPHSHVGDLRRLIFFGYDSASDSVVVGPMRFKTGDAPHTLEFGGYLITNYARMQGRDSRGRFTRARVVHGDARRVFIAPRPYMGPALQAERPHIPRMWRNSVRG